MLRGKLPEDIEETPDPLFVGLVMAVALIGILFLGLGGYFQ